ncbi:hypothetical protein ALC57_11951, partial [Trachymyrmex cornetzi]
VNEWSDRKLPAPIAMPFKSVKPSKKICAADAMEAVNIYSDNNSKSRRQCKRQADRENLILHSPT